MRLIIEDALGGLAQDLRSGLFTIEGAPGQQRSTRDEARQILVSCLLSSGWKYEKATAAAQFFAKQFPTAHDVPSMMEIESFLSHASVRHRFPKSKAKQLHAALAELAFFPLDMMFQGTDVKGERVVRDILQRKFSGLGYKQTSMFMRNIGAANNLAVIDAHILWYLKVCKDIDPGSLTPKKYKHLEDIILECALIHQLDMNSFDIILWVLIREFKKSERMRTCGTQFVLPLAA